MILLSHPLGNANARQAALALSEGELLAELWTCLNWTPGSLPDRLLPRRLAVELGRRTFPATLRDRLHTSPVREAGRLLAGRLPGGRWLTRHEAGWCSVDAVFQALDARVARRVAGWGKRQPPLTGVYAYEDAAASTFRAAASRGLKCFYDLPIGYWRFGQAIFEEEAQLVPAWAATLTGRSDSPAKLARKDEELLSASTVIVASSFTRRTLEQAPGFSAEVTVIPYGAPAPGNPPAASARTGQPLRVLFAGSLGQRKGLSYLLDAIAPMGRHVELTLLGSRPVEGCQALDAAVRQHRWIPSLPHAEVLAEMGRQDVLVFPSLFEGFGLVIPEALSQGLPVIATAHTAGPDLLSPGADGFIVPIRSAEAITEKLELLVREPERLAAMKEAAFLRAKGQDWAVYRERLRGVVRALLHPSVG